MYICREYGDVGLCRDSALLRDGIGGQVRIISERQQNVRPLSSRVRSAWCRLKLVQDESLLDKVCRRIDHVCYSQQQPGTVKF